MITEIPEGFNWLTILADLGNGAWMSEDKMGELQDMAQRWPTCACGQLCRQLPRMEDGCPKDSKLRGLGGSFADKVNRRQWCKALDIFQQIEARTTELLEEQGVIIPS